MKQLVLLLLWYMFNIDMSLMYNWVICISTTGHYCSVASNNPINVSLTWNYLKQISYIILKCKKYSIIQNTILIEVNVVFYYLGSLWSLPVFGGVHVVFDWSGCIQGLLYSTLYLIRGAVFDWSGCIQGLLYSTLYLIRGSGVPIIRNIDLSVGPHHTIRWSILKPCGRFWFYSV